MSVCLAHSLRSLSKPNFAQTHLFKQVQDANPQWAGLLSDFDTAFTSQFEPVKTNDSPKASFVLPRQYREWERRIEDEWVSHLRRQCEVEADHRQQRMQHAAGFFGFGRDEESLARLKAQSLPACEKLREYGYIRY